MKDVSTLILGGGLAGLAAAYKLRELGENSFLVIEKRETAGGLLRTSKGGGFEIDELPHVFFSGDQELTGLFHELIPDCVTHESRLGTLTDGTFTDYPFQLNVHQLSHGRKVECLRSFFAALQQGGSAAPVPVDLEEHFSQAFGSAMTELFFRPYNEKLWCSPLRDLCLDWIGRKIQPVTLDEMASSFLGREDACGQRFGPHSRFHYPRSGGIQRLAEALLSRAGPEHLALSEEVVRVDTAARKVHTDKRVIEYERLIWTLPLPLAEFLVVPACPPAAALSWTGVSSVHLAARNLKLPENHWIYLADRDLSAYRITRVDQINPSGSSALAPIIVEVSHPAGTTPDGLQVTRQVIEELVRIGAVSSAADIAYHRCFFNSPAYVVYDHLRAGTLETLQDYFAGVDIVPAGRFGEWSFFNMDDTIRSGFSAARDVLEPKVG